MATLRNKKHRVNTRFLPGYSSDDFFLGSGHCLTPDEVIGDLPKDPVPYDPIYDYFVSDRWCFGSGAGLRDCDNDGFFTEEEGFNKTRRS